MANDSSGSQRELDWISTICVPAEVLEFGLFVYDMPAASAGVFPLREA